MKSKLSFKSLIIIIITTCAVITTAVILFSSQNIQSQASYSEPIPIPPTISQALQNLINSQSTGFVNSTTTNQPKVGLPIRLIIPIIKVNAAFEYLGLTSGGAMDVPKGPDNVAWFDLGARPGDIGSAVVAGHYGWKNNIPAVFDNLYKLKKGNKIYVVDDKNSTSTFVVKEIGIYDQNGDAANVFNSNDGMAHLNLVTCEGVWNAVLKGRPSRLVIFTTKE